jgi:N-acetylglutamate synthase-like GNAT family acetyltransferase
MKIFWNEETHLPDFIQLNNEWIEQFFELEENDHRLAKDPGKIIRNGGYVLTITDNNRVVGCCALFKKEKRTYEVARMAVCQSEQGKGIGKLLINEILSFAQKIAARKLYLVSNTRLEAAIHLYKSFGFITVYEGQHPSYRRGNIVMEKYTITDQCDEPAGLVQ